MTQQNCGSLYVKHAFRPVIIFLSRSTFNIFLSKGMNVGNIENQNTTPESNEANKKLETASEYKAQSFRSEKSLLLVVEEPGYLEIDETKLLMPSAKG